MRYIDKITLRLDNIGNIKVDEILFRESICKPCNDLYDAGFLDKTDFALIGNNVTKLRFSEYLPEEKMAEMVLRLRNFYNVGYYEATYYYKNKVMFFDYKDKRQMVRIFPLEDYRKMKEMKEIEELKLGVIYINNDE